MITRYADANRTSLKFYEVVNVEDRVSKKGKEYVKFCVADKYRDKKGEERLAYVYVFVFKNLDLEDGDFVSFLSIDAIGYQPQYDKFSRLTIFADVEVKKKEVDKVPFSEIAKTFKLSSTPTTVKMVEGEKDLPFI